MPRSIAWLVLVVACAGCEAVPELDFEEPDGGSVASGSTTGADSRSDGGVGALFDAEAHDAPSIPTADSGPVHADSGGPPKVDAGSTSCPSHVPAGADGCCGAVPCVGDKCQTRCMQCGACADSFCCVSNGMGHVTTCAASAGACPN